MYGWLWRQIPGPTPVRVLVTLVSVVALFFLLMEVIYPLVEQVMPFSDVSVG